MIEGPWFDLKRFLLDMAIIAVICVLVVGTCALFLELFGK